MTSKVATSGHCRSSRLADPTMSTSRLPAGTRAAPIVASSLTSRPSAWVEESYRSPSSTARGTRSLSLRRSAYWSGRVSRALARVEKLSTSPWWGTIEIISAAPSTDSRWRLRSSRMGLAARYPRKSSFGSRSRSTARWANSRRMSAAMARRRSSSRSCS
ncbi:hypothetical protein [Nonomuraea sp. B19D2]|uniref:hypothetical protein n=1 Tax=Nonomuraea sp. B19D2 TaxID=3159561 RepID=UPI0032DA5A7B